ncbi:hypothetical protein ACT17Q_01655 [Cellulomonas sp. CW35]|uniref:hypothetical protein n=1 Tax=Cellulomonas sp. CW35 TaxID=3458249 RepID=UPI00403321F1
MVTAGDWSEYDRWNDAIAEVLFPELVTPVPVYLDLEDEALGKIGSRLGLQKSDVVARLSEVVARTSILGSNHAFKAHHVRFVRWLDGGRASLPPIFPVLSVFSLAAERMAAGSGMSAANYYGRLAEILDAKSEHMGFSYRAVAEPLWGALNSWLSGLRGARGLPTAFSVGQRYVGISVSQALVREADRRRLERFYVDFEFAPRSAVPPVELEPLLDAWFSQDPSPATHHLMTLWSKPQLRAHIAEVAATELAEWDGADEASTDGHSSRSRVVLSMELTSFPSRRLRLSPFFFAAQAGVARTADLATPDGPVPAELEPGMNGALALVDRGLVDTSDLLEGTLRVVDPLAGEMVRQPRRLVVFRKDELSGRWLEARQVLMGDDVTVLVSGPVLAQARSILTEVARPGWTVVDSMAGLPEGWTLVRGVEIFARPLQAVPTLSELSALVPLTTSQLKLGAGLSLPSAARNLWHVRRPPEVRAIDDSGEPIEVRLFDLGAPGSGTNEQLLVDTWSDGGTGSVVVDLGEAQLAEGDYAVELVVGDGNVPRARKELLLRSSDSPDMRQWESVAPIIHDVGHPLAVLGADPGAEGHSVGPGVHGVVLEDVPSIGPVALVKSVPWWKQGADEARSGAVRLSRPEPGSCFYTGAHHEVLDAAISDSRGRPLTKYTTGTCKFCGLQRRYSSSYWTNRRKHERAQMAASQPRAVVSSRVPAVRTEDGGVDWDLALDAIRCLGGGPISLLERVARQLDPSRLFLHQFVRTLESLGHIEVRRSDATLEVLSWEVCDTRVIDVGDRRVWAGFWTPDMVSAAERHFDRLGRLTGWDAQASAPSRVWTTAAPDEVGAWTEVGDIPVAESAARDLVSVLPTLSTLLGALPRKPSPSLLGAQWFDPTSAAWQAVADMDSPGAYRVGRYGSKYYVRTASDLATGQVTVADAAVAKHAASALLTARALVAYDERAGDLVVPLGANLPGMYERAAVLESGTAPLKRRGRTVYRDVSPYVAGRLAYLLEN